MGRPRKLTAEQEAEVHRMYFAEGYKIITIAKEMNVSYAVAYNVIARERAAKKYEAEQQQAWRPA